jgi:hypothetical protein
VMLGSVRARQASNRYPKHVSSFFQLLRAAVRGELSFA